MSVSSPEISLSSSSTTSSTKEDVVDYWEVNPPPEPASHLPQLASMNCWDYAIEFDCLKGPEGRCSSLPYSFLLINCIGFIYANKRWKKKKEEEYFCGCDMLKVNGYESNVVFFSDCGSLILQRNTRNMKEFYLRCYFAVMWHIIILCACRLSSFIVLWIFPWMNVITSTKPPRRGSSAQNVNNVTWICIW